MDSGLRVNYLNSPTCSQCASLAHSKHQSVSATPTSLDGSSGGLQVGVEGCHLCQQPRPWLRSIQKPPCDLLQLYMGLSQNWGSLFGAPRTKDYSIVKSPLENYHMGLTELTGLLLSQAYSLIGYKGFALYKGCLRIPGTCSASQRWLRCRTQSPDPDTSARGESGFDNATLLTRKRRLYPED